MKMTKLYHHNNFVLGDMHAYQVMLKFHGRLITPFLVVSMSVSMNILICQFVNGFMSLIR